VIEKGGWHEDQKEEEPLAIPLRYNLEAQGFEVIEAGSGEEAERVVRATPPDLINWILPGLAGIELCRRLRSRAETQTGADDFAGHSRRRPLMLALAAWLALPSVHVAMPFRARTSSPEGAPWPN
jgi:CheY-like chemotaxis protein